MIRLGSDAADRVDGLLQPGDAEVVHLVPLAPGLLQVVAGRHLLAHQGDDDEQVQHAEDRQRRQSSPTTTTAAIAIMTPDQASPVANQRPQNHSATTATNATP